MRSSGVSTDNQLVWMRWLEEKDTGKVGSLPHEALLSFVL